MVQFDTCPCSTALIYVRYKETLTKSDGLVAIPWSSKQGNLQPFKPEADH